MINDLSQDDEPALQLGQIVNVIGGKHIGKIGKAHRLYGTQSDEQLELVVGDEHILVYSDEIDFKFKSAESALFMDDDAREEFLKRIEDYESGYLSSL